MPITRYLSLRLAGHRDGLDYVTSIVICGPRIESPVLEGRGGIRAAGVTEFLVKCVNPVPKPTKLGPVSLCGSQPRWGQCLCGGALLEHCDFSVCVWRGKLFFSVQLFQKV